MNIEFRQNLATPEKDFQVSTTPDAAIPSTPAKPATLKGRWKWGAGLFLIACVAQSILWTIFWEDPTHFKMSILFVWPAAIFFLLIWWFFCSGWSSAIRFGSVGIGAAALVAFFSQARLVWDGDMVPRRVEWRSTPTPEEVAKKFFEQETTTKPAIDGDLLKPEKLVVTDEDWPGFRGPNRDGIVTHAEIRRDWSANPPQELWRHPVGRAWSAFSIIGQLAFTQEQRQEMECVVAYDLMTGTQVWVHQDPALLSIVEANGGPGPHATPQFDDGMLYTLGGTGILNCLDPLTGDVVWTTNILKDAGSEKQFAKPPEWGVSHTPLIVDGLVIVIPGGTATEGSVDFNKGVAAYDKKTGELKWSAGKHAPSYGSPRVETIQGVRQLLITNGNGLSGHSIENGEELWFYPLENAPKVNSSMPWKLDDESVLFGTGYGVGSVRIDVKKEGDRWEATKRWTTNRFRPKFNDFIIRDGYAYGLDDGTLCCLDLKNGSIKWKAGRYGYGQLLLFNDLLAVISEDGELMLIPATPGKPEVIASKQIFTSGFCWNHMAYSRGKLLLRNANEAACLDIGVAATAPAQSGEKAALETEAKPE